MMVRPGMRLGCMAGEGFVGATGKHEYTPLVCDKGMLEVEDVPFRVGALTSSCIALARRNLQHREPTDSQPQVRCLGEGRGTIALKTDGVGLPHDEVERDCALERPEYACHAAERWNSHDIFEHRLDFISLHC